MPAGYADKMAAVIDNIPALIIAILLVVPVALIAIKLAGRLMRKQAALLI